MQLFLKSLPILLLFPSFYLIVYLKLQSFTSAYYSLLLIQIHAIKYSLISVSLFYLSDRICL